MVSYLGVVPFCLLVIFNFYLFEKMWYALNVDGLMLSYRSYISVELKESLRLFNRV